MRYESDAACEAPTQDTWSIIRWLKHTPNTDLMHPMRKWDRLVQLRDSVNLELEKARADKRIGKPLEAKIILNCNESMLEF